MKKGVGEISLTAAERIFFPCFLNLSDLKQMVTDNFNVSIWPWKSGPGVGMTAAAAAAVVTGVPFRL